MNTNIIILGAEGMLGQQMMKTLSDSASAMKWELHPTSRNVNKPGFRGFSFPGSHVEDLLSECRVGEGDFVLNCAGWIPQRSAKENSNELLDAVMVNSVLPLTLEAICKDKGVRLISIGTDCVFSGTHDADYTEESPLSPADFYGTTKALAEASHGDHMILRTSIVGQSPRTLKGLFEWFKCQPRGAEIDGYVDHMWNGTSTNFFSRVVSGIIKHNEYSPGVQHLVPLDSCSKAELLEMFKQKLGRYDVSIRHGMGDTPTRRVLGTSNLGRNNLLWNLGGFEAPPTIRQAVDSI